jgi:hypothetical protein
LPLGRVVERLLRRGDGFLGERLPLEVGSGLDGLADTLSHRPLDRPQLLRGRLPVISNKLRSLADDGCRLPLVEPEHLRELAGITKDGQRRISARVHDSLEPAQRFVKLREMLPEDPARQATASKGGRFLYVYLAADVRRQRL